jgi:hypothetical protein
LAAKKTFFPSLRGMVIHEEGRALPAALAAAPCRMSHCIGFPRLESQLQTKKPPFSCTISCSEVPPAFSRQHLFQQLSHISLAARELRCRSKAWLSQHM